MRTEEIIRDCVEKQKLSHTPNAHCTKCGTVGWQVNPCPCGCGDTMTTDDLDTIRERYIENHHRVITVPR